MSDNELINGTSFVFCGSKWTSLAPSSAPACLTESDITAMDYFISGVEDRGLITVPPAPKKKSFAKWKIALIVLCSVLGLAVIIALVFYVATRYFHVLIISKEGAGGTGDEW